MSNCFAFHMVTQTRPAGYLCRTFSHNGRHIAMYGLQIPHLITIYAPGSLRMETPVGRVRSLSVRGFVRLFRSSVSCRSVSSVRSPFRPGPWSVVVHFPFRSVTYHAVPCTFRAVQCGANARAFPYRAVSFRSVPCHSIPFRSVPFRALSSGGRSAGKKNENKTRNTPRRRKKTRKKARLSRHGAATTYDAVLCTARGGGYRYDKARRPLRHGYDPRADTARLSGREGSGGSRISSRRGPRWSLTRGTLKF